MRGTEMPYKQFVVTIKFKNSHFETFCHDLGLEHQFSSPYTPPQNDIVERKTEPCVR
jgi:hypothetical protein